MPRAPRTLSYESAIASILYGAALTAPFVLILVGMTGLSLSSKMADKNGIILAGVGKGAFALTMVALICERLVGRFDGRILKMAAVAAAIDIVLTLTLWTMATALPLPWLIRALLYLLGLLATPATWALVVRHLTDGTIDFGRPQEA